jgi:hypothetical protein
MAINSGAGPHRAWINGLLVTDGYVDQQAVKKSSTFSVTLPLNGGGESLADGGSAVITVQSAAGSATLLTGVIDCVDLDYIKTRVRVSGRDLSAKLHEQQSSEKWINKTGSDIVQELAGRVGLSVSSSVTNQLKAGKKLYNDYVKMTDNVTYAQVIHKLAEFDGARWWVDPQGTFHYADLGNPEGVYTLNYDRGPPIVSDCLQLQVSVNLKASEGQQVTVKSWHPKDKKVHTGNATGGGGGMLYNFHIPNFDQQYAQQYAEARVKELARHGVCVKAGVVGDTTISAGMGVQLNGTGQWDALYEIDCASHEFGMNGYVTNITAKAPKGGS